MRTGISVQLGNICRSQHGGLAFREESQSHIKVVWSHERAVLLHQHGVVKERKLMGTAAAGPMIRP